MNRIFLKNMIYLLLVAVMLFSSCKTAPDDSLLVDDENILGAEGAFIDEDGGTVINTDIRNLRTQRMAENEETIFFTMEGKQTAASFGVPIFLMAADRAANTVRPVCSKPDCTHQDASCGAYLPSGGSFSVVSVSDDRLFYSLRTAEGRKLLRRKLPDGAEEEVCTVNYTDMLPENPDTVWISDTTCIYDGDYYSQVCAGVGGDDRSRRETELYATVYRTPVTSGREARVVFQDKVTGFDGYQLHLMPRREGLYIIVLQSKDEETDGISRTERQLLSIYLCHPDRETSQQVFDIIFTCEYQDPEFLGNLNIRDGKMYFVKRDGEGKTCFYSQEFMEKDPTLLAVLSEDPERGIGDCFYSDGLCVYDFLDESIGEYSPDVINIRCFGYDGKEFSKVSARKPDTLKPQHPEDYAIPEMDGVLNGGSEFLGCDTYALYFNAYYYSPSDRTKSESYFWGVTMDGERFLRFEKE